MGEPDPFCDIELGEDVTVYKVIALPPLLDGALNDIKAWPSPDELLQM